MFFSYYKCTPADADAAAAAALMMTDPAGGDTLTVAAGDNVTMSCVGVANSSIAWYRSGRRLALHDWRSHRAHHDGVTTVEIAVDEDRNRRRSTIVRRSVRRATAAGTYTCLDENEDGLAASRTVTLVVIGDDPPLPVGADETGEHRRAFLRISA